MTGQLFPHPVQPRDTDERYTPRWVFDGLGVTFDTDPASPGHGGGDYVPARIKYTAADDGLAQPWTGLVWLNPPFSNATPWARRFVEHASGIFLGPVANSAWLTELFHAADLVWICRDFAFIHPEHAGRHTAFPIQFSAIGPTATAALDRLARSGVHDGTLVRRIYP